MPAKILIPRSLRCQRHSKIAHFYHYKWQSKIAPFDLVLSFNLWLNPYSFFYPSNDNSQIWYV